MPRSAAYRESRGITIGSTVAALLAMDGRFACLWAGDSRIYLVRNGAISQISKDHTEVQELLDRGMISAAEALTWPRRNVITHAVGVSDDIVIDFQQGELMPGDVFVLSHRRADRACHRRRDRGRGDVGDAAGGLREPAGNGAGARRNGQCHHRAREDRKRAQWTVASP